MELLSIEHHDPVKPFLPYGRISTSRSLFALPPTVHRFSQGSNSSIVSELSLVQQEELALWFVFPGQCGRLEPILHRAWDGLGST
jgi:hypothetical protein